MARAEEVRMQVVRDPFRRDLEHRRQVLDRLDERRAGRRVVEIADVLRDERLVAARHADRILEIAAERDDRRPRSWQLDRARRVAAGAAHELEAAGRAIGARTQHAVVAARDDRTVVHEQRVGDARKTPDGFVVVDHQRLAAGIGAGHHEHELVRHLEPRRAVRSPRRLVEQQVLQRRVRQHRAEPRERRAQRREGIRRRARALRNSTIGRSAELSERMLCGSHGRERRQRSDIGRHDRERLLLARLARPQPGHGVAVARIAGQVKSAEALDRNDLAATQDARPFR